MSVGSVRIDRWLCASRVFKSRSLAQQACLGGLVKVNGLAVRPSHAVKVRDEVSAEAPRGPVVLIVLALAEKRLSPPEARSLYEDRSPPPPPPEERVALRPRGSGRPTKTQRRALERLRAFEYD
jgi:ribosome-associated heat shock protein Hsp15